MSTSKPIYHSRNWSPPQLRSVASRSAALLLVGTALCLPRYLARADDIAPGHDLYDTLPLSHHELDGPYAIPAGFFGPGSDPFTGRVDLHCEPMAPVPTCGEAFDNVGILMRRPVTAQLPGPGSSQTIPIEIVALSLVSVNPITVTYNGGNSPEAWDVRMLMSQLAQPPQQGSATILHTSAAGGTFSAQLPIVPRLEFVKVQPQPEPPRPLDYGATSFFDIFTVVDIPWSHGGPSSLQPTLCASNFRPTVVGGSSQQQGVIDGPFTHLVVQWPVGGPVPEVDHSWGAVKALYGQ